MTLRDIAADVAAKGYERAGIVAHGGIFMSMLARFGLPARSYYDWMLPNCSGYRAELETGPLALRVFAAVGRAKV